MTDSPLKIDTSAKSSPPSKKKRGVLFWILIIAAFFTLVDLVGVLVPMLASRNAQNEQPAVQQPTTTAKNETDKSTPVDESQLQWASPTDGPPITLEYVPQGAQAILFLRPAELLANREGAKLITALGPWGAQTVQQVQETLSVEFQEIETLLVALISGDNGWQYSLRVTLAEPWDEGKIAQRSKSTMSGARAIFSPQSGQGRVIVSCPQSSVEELRSQEDAPAILARDLERLLAHTDADRTATLLMSAKFLDTEGRELLSQQAEGLRTAFHALIPDNASAVAISVNLGDQFFLELQATTIQNAPAHRFADKFTKQLASAEQQLAAFLISNPPHPYGKAVEDRFPAMLKMTCDYTRTSHTDGIAMARCYLPLPAAHNLLLASRLRLSETGQPLTLVAKRASVSEQLDQVTTLSFPKETLEKALEMLAGDLKIPIQIAGRDLQLEGITKNQTLSLDLRERPSREILVEILRQANPDRTATSASDPRQKLVYVIRGDAIIVTTRSAAAQRSEELPEVFRVSPP